MNLTPTEERSILKHPVEAILAALLLVSLLFVATDHSNGNGTEQCAATAASCSGAP